MAKLTVTHDGFMPGSTVLTASSEGWAAVLSSLKTLLETEVYLADELGPHHAATSRRIAP